MTDQPPHIQEFSVIAALVFSQLYKEFPKVLDQIDKNAIASAFGVSGDWAAFSLPSGRYFNEMLSYTIAWLSAEDFIRSSGGHPAERVSLTAKGFTAMNAVPFGISGAPRGVELTKATDKPRIDYGSIGELIGGIFGGFTKSAVSG